MRTLLISRITVVWLGLVVASCVSLELFRGIAWLDQPRLGGMAVMLIAFLKARFILLDFMELREAPLPLRLFAEGWWLLIGAIVVLTFGTDFFGL